MLKAFCTPKGTNIGNNIYKLGDKYYKVIRVKESEDTNVNEILFSFLTNGFIDSNDFNKILPYLVFSEFNDKEENDLENYSIIEMTIDLLNDSFNVENKNTKVIKNRYIVSGIKQEYLPQFDRREMGISALFNSNDNGSISDDKLAPLQYAFNNFYVGEIGDAGYISGDHDDLHYYYKNTNVTTLKRIYFNERTYFLLLVMYYTSGYKLNKGQIEFLESKFEKYKGCLEYTCPGKTQQQDTNDEPMVLRLEKLEKPLY